jgi:signal transduction histidine kinase
LVPDQRPVEQLVPAGTHPTLHDRVHSGYLDAAEYDLERRRRRLRRTGRLLRNLVSNAICHTPPGTNVRIDAHRRDGWIDVVVADDGPGVPPAVAARVFERFYRGDPTHPAAAGTGLGLSIVAAIARAHGGTVDFASTPGRGTTVTVTLPHGGCDDGGFRQPETT